MGGNALKNTIIKRIDIDNYQRIKKYIISQLESNGFTTSEILEIPEKNSFGDLDLLYLNKEKDTNDINQCIIKLFKPNEIVSNGDVLSFDFEQFQIDLIKCSSLEQMQFAKFYFSYGDVGGIIGRICSSYGLKFGHNGLFAVLYENTIYPEKEFDVKNTTQQILLSNKMCDVCDFLGLDWLYYSKGFNNLNDIFDWIIKSKYFNIKLFSTFNSDHIKRLKIRPMYINFIDYIGINKNNIYRGFEFTCNIQPEAIAYFNKIELVENVKKELEIKKIVQNKFNGKYLIERGYDGKQTGIILNEMKKHIDKEYQISWEQWIYNSDIDMIYKLLDGIILKCGFKNISI